MNFGDPRLPDRFWSKCIPEPNSGCWLWIGNTNANGYGRYAVKRHNGVQTWACPHRVTYEARSGKPDKPELDHLCRTRQCCNPQHLEPVTHRENVLRGESIPAKLAKKTHCINGHPLSGANIIIVPTRPNSRHCKACAIRYRQR